MQAYLEGPYGSPMIDVHGSRYKCFLLISGGIGWTFLRAWRRQLLQDARRGRPVKAVTTVAVVRATDQHHLPEITDTLNPGAGATSMDLPRGLRLEARSPSPGRITHTVSPQITACRCNASHASLFRDVCKAWERPTCSSACL